MPSSARRVRLRIWGMNGWGIFCVPSIRPSCRCIALATTMISACCRFSHALLPPRSLIAHIMMREQAQADQEQSKTS